MRWDEEQKPFGTAYTVHWCGERIERLYIPPSSYVSTSPSFPTSWKLEGRWRLLDGWHTQRPGEPVRRGMRLRIWLYYCAPLLRALADSLVADVVPVIAALLLRMQWKVSSHVLPANFSVLSLDTNFLRTWWREETFQCILNVF